MKTLYLECAMGAAGDMLTAALLELVEDRDAFLRKMNSIGLPGVRVEAEEAVKCGITGTHMKVTVDGEEVRLTALEYQILEYLMRNMGHVLSSAQIYEAVWNEPALSTEKTVTVHIRNIREKIEIDPKNPNYLKVVWGLGYKVDKI